MSPVAIPGVLMIIIKILCLIGLAVYTVFAWILVRQEQLMAHVLEEAFEPYVRTAASVHLVLTCVAFLLAAVFLP